MAGLLNSSPLENNGTRRILGEDGHRHQAGRSFGIGNRRHARDRADPSVRAVVRRLKAFLQMSILRQRLLPPDDTAGEHKLAEKADGQSNQHAEIVVDRGLTTAIPFKRCRNLVMDPLTGILASVFGLGFLI
jgi:hypothetical protein